MSDEKCPKCGAAFAYRDTACGETIPHEHWLCRSWRYHGGVIIESSKCLTRQLTAANDVVAVAAKILLCFPDDDDAHEFNIPGYIIEELREAAKGANRE